MMARQSISVGFFLLFCAYLMAFAQALPEFDARYGPWIVEFDKSVAHEDFHSTIHESLSEQNVRVPDAGIHMHFKHALWAVVVHGMQRETVEKMEGVERVHENTMKHTSLYSWGLDRIDQTSLPLNKSESYEPHYHGVGVDVYVIDTGIDCDHIEFAPNEFNRTCANIFNPYGTLSSNTDGNSHGTHCAGTVGGNTIGVSKGANLYGLKGLSDSGWGTTAHIIACMDYAMQRHLSKPGARSVVSMSLGGTCQNLYCIGDADLIAVQNLFKAGLVVAVAAGNDACNAIGTSPAAAPNAITVGSTQIDGKKSSFSNFGQGNDIFAPGSNIISAYTSKLTGGNETRYIEYSGTSMATPHVAGVAAQLLEKEPTATPDLVIKAMQCDAVKNQIVMAPYDTLSKNLLLQIPKNDSQFGTCDLDDGTKCSDEGTYMTAYANYSGLCVDTINSTHCEIFKGYGWCDVYASYMSYYCEQTCGLCYNNADLGSTEKICFCDGGLYGDSCAKTNNQTWPTVYTCDEDSDDRMPVQVIIWGLWSQQAQYGVFNRTTDVVEGYAFDSECEYRPTDSWYCIFPWCDESSDYKNNYCIAPGHHTFRVTEGLAPTGTNYWEICGKAGKGPFEGLMKVEKVDGVWGCDLVNYTGIATSEDFHWLGLSADALSIIVLTIPLLCLCILCIGGCVAVAMAAQGKILQPAPSQAQPYAMEMTSVRTVSTTSGATMNPIVADSGMTAQRTGSTAVTGTTV